MNLGVLAALAGFAMVCFAILAVPACGWTACHRVPWAAIGLGFALAISIVVWVHRTAAVILAALAAAAWWLAVREGHPPTWVTVAFALLVSGAAIMALAPWRDISEPQRKNAAAEPATSSAQPPAGNGSTWVAPRTTVASIVLVALGSALLWWLVQRRLPWWFGSEGAWYVWAVAVVGLGLGLGWRAVSLNRSRRRFLTSPQPVRSVQVLLHPTGVYVALPSTAIAHFPIKARFPARLEMVGGPRYAWRGANIRSGRERPALLYGDPLATHWCAVVVDSELLAPFGSTEILSDQETIRASRAHRDPHSPFTDERDHRHDDVDYRDDDGGGRELDYEPRGVTDADRSASRDGVRTHRLAWERAYALVPLSVAAVSAVATIVCLNGFVGVFHPSVSVLVALALAVLGSEIVWRVLVRPRLAWNDSGIALVTGRGVQYLRWDEVSSIERDQGVKLLARREKHVIATYALSRWLAPDQRRPRQLIAALLASKRRAEHTPEAYRPLPPPLDYPTRSPMLWVLASGCAIAVAYFLLALANSSR